MARKPEPVDADEVKDAVLRMLVERFDDRPLSWEDATMGLARAAGYYIRHGCDMQGRFLATGPIP